MYEARFAIFKGGGRGGGVSYYLQTKLHFGKKIGRSALKSRSTKNRRI